MGIKHLFLATCDGSSMLEPHEDMPNTYQMGVCKLDYDELKNELTVHLRRPGILIGKGDVHNFFLSIGFDQVLHYVQLFVTYQILFG